MKSITRRALLFRAKWIVGDAVARGPSEVVDEDARAGGRRNGVEVDRVVQVRDRSAEGERVAGRHHSRRDRVAKLARDRTPAVCYRVDVRVAVFSLSRGAKQGGRNLSDPVANLKTVTIMKPRDAVSTRAPCLSPLIRNGTF